MSLSEFQVDLVLDRLKHKGATKRVLFLHGKTSRYTKNMTVSNGRGPACEEQEAFLIVSYPKEMDPSLNRTLSSYDLRGIGLVETI